jgi:hypothetical protein
VTYIEKLQEDKKLLIDFFHAYKDLAAKETNFENSAYKGDARKAADVAHHRLDTLRVKIEDMIAKQTNKKEAVNA